MLKVLRLVGSLKASQQAKEQQQPAAMGTGRRLQAVEQPPEDSDVQAASLNGPDPNFALYLDDVGEGREEEPPSASNSEAEQEEEEQQSGSGSEASPPPARRSGRAAKKQQAAAEEEESSSEEESEEEEEESSESESESEATSPAAQRSSKHGGAARQPAAKPAARRSGRAAQQQTAAEEESSSEEEAEEEQPEQPARRAGTARQQPQRGAGSQRQMRSAATDTASEGSGASGVSGRRAVSRQRPGGSQAAAPSRLGRGSSRLQPQGQPEPQPEEQQGQQASFVARKAAAGELPCSAALKHLTVAQLQAECTGLGLPAKGHKADLQAQLLRWWEQQMAVEQPPAVAPQRAQQQQQQKQGSIAGGKRKGRQASAAEAEDDAEEEEQEAEQPAAKRTRRGAQAASASKQPQQQPQQQGRRRRQEPQAAAAPEAEAQRQEEQEEEEEEQRGRKRRSARKPSGRRRAGTAGAEPSPSPLACQGSPAAAAAGQQLEMSLPPERVGAAAAAAAHVSDDEEMADAGEGAAGAAAARSRAHDPAAAAAGYLRRRLTQPRSEEAATMALRPRLQEVHRSLLDSLNSTVWLGHNNSLLVVGPRGSGKTLAVERAVADLAAQYNKDPKDPVVGIIRLSGQVHADERTAFRELARQLCGAFGYQFSKAASIGENIEFLRGMLARLQECEKVALFLLDDFDGFAGKRAKQTVLYNLLDALQTSGMLAAVVGVTCRQDVMELLEKRVKSRFSHRKLDVSLPTSALPVAAQAADNEAGVMIARQAQDGALELLQSMLTLPPQFAHREFAAKWNSSVAAAAGSAGVKQALQRCVNVFPSLRHLANVADWALAAAGGSSTLTSAALVGALERQLSQAKGMITMISGLPILDLILLVAVQRLAQRDKHDVNFEMAHHEFSKYSLVGAHVDSYSRGAAAKAYDHLLSLGLLAFVDPRSEARVGSRQYAPAYLLVTRQEVEEGLAAHHNCPQSLTEWLKKEGGLGTTAGQFLG